MQFHYVLLLVGAYLVGSVPSGYLLTLAVTGVDVRQHGSNNVGAINVFRVGGRLLGGLTLLADVSKGAAVVVIVHVLEQPEWMIAASALAVLVGHAFSFWLLLREQRFSEGKCVATSLGVLTGISFTGYLPWWVPASLVVFWVCGLMLPKLLTGRWWMISPVTMSAAAGISMLVVATRPSVPFVWMGCAMSALILARHKNNIIRLVAGREPRIGENL